MSALRNSWHHISRSPLQSFTAIFVMFLSFFVITSFLIISNGFSSVLKHFETKPEITIYLKDGLSLEKVEGIQKNLSAYPGVKEIRFISKEKALVLYKEQNQDNPMLTEMVTANILPASFEVSVEDPLILEKIATDFNPQNEVVDEIIYQKDIINSLLSWTKIIRQSGLIIIGVSSLVSFFVIFVIIGMKITNRKDEIRISRLLGASKYYVKKSFILEGLFYGLVGSIIGAFLSSFIFYYFGQNINTFFQPIPFVIFDIYFYLKILLAAVVSGILIGFTASWVGVKRYIKF